MRDWSGAAVSTTEDRYRVFQNAELLAAVEQVLPASGAVLDIGCASGGLLAHLRGRASRRVGVEVSPVAAREAATVADEVVQRAIDDELLDFPPGAFDVIVCGDVLEHLPEPQATLRRAVTWLASDGAVVISVPNIANWQSRFRLLRGRWDYEPYGIWDVTHLRFFTLATLHELVRDAGLHVESIQTTQVVLMQVPLLRVLPRRLREMLESFLQVLARIRPQLFAYQFICVARRA